MRLPLASLIILAVAVFVCGDVLHAAEPFFKKSDVIALVGGEDMVATSESGYFELLLARALPDLHLRFRNLAWEGDSVFEQRRELNFPTWEEQLDKIGATVVIAQFGQMESFEGKAKLREFMAAYEALLERFKGGGKRRLVVITPNHFGKEESPSAEEVKRRNTDLDAYRSAILAMRSGPLAPVVVTMEIPQTRDGIHLSRDGQVAAANQIGRSLEPRTEDFYRVPGSGLERAENTQLRQLLALIVAKNKLWFDYWRPQNWAFLAGDRTSQPSSRDHLDPSKRWFPPEREQFLPLIEAKENEIDALATQLAK